MRKISYRYYSLVCEEDPPFVPGVATTADHPKLAMVVAGDTKQIG
jgi:hypothetical protein